MKMKIVYALTSSAHDYYLEQAYVSMFSLKHHMPDAFITVVTDDKTSSSFVGIRKNELQYADEVIVIPFDSSYTQHQRSRLLKASIRKFVTGDYLYIDCDTIICHPFPSLESISYDLAACVDTHCHDFHDNPYRWMCLAHGHALDWPIDNESTYFNGGVLFVKDSQVAHEFYERWHQNLMNGFSNGVFMDQPSFAKTNYQMHHIVGVLDDIWNCELKHGIRFLKDALIVHYLTTNVSPQNGAQVFRLNEPDLFEKIKETGNIPEEIEAIANDPFKGLASLTHVFAGKDVYFFQTPAYKILTSLNTSYKESLISTNSSQDFVQSPLFFYFLRNYPHGLAGWLSRAYIKLVTIKKKLKP